MVSLLQIDKVTKQYGDKKVLDGVSFSIEKGEIFGLLGPNGSGKSTLMKIISGILDASSGTVFLDNADTKLRPKETKRKIVLVPQEFAFFSELSVKENLDYFSSQLGANPNKTGEVISRLGLKQFANAAADNLSGGYKRMLNIAISLLQNPEIIFLDEPSVGLDPVVRSGLWEKILEIREQGVTICISTHYMEEAAALCDRVCLINSGKIFALDSPDNIIRKFADEQVGVFTLKQLPTEDLVSKIVKSVKGVAASISGTSIIVKFSEKNLLLNEMAKQTIESNGFNILKVRMKEPDLEQAFINLTGKQLAEN